VSTPQRVALVLVVNGDGQLLMGKRGDSGLYVIPGGHVEPGEEPEQAAIRELGEEAGLDVDKVSPVKVYPAQGDRPELHLFSALAPMGVEPHGRRDPDQEVPTEDWEWVDARGGLPAKVLEHLHVPGDRNVLPGIYDLKKVQPPITFPKLGVGDDRRETPIVDSRPALRSKIFALHAAVPPGQRQMTPADATEVEERRPGNGFASTIPGRTTGYSLSTSMRAATAAPHEVSHPLWQQHHLDQNADVSTVQHENFHQIMNRVRDQHGYQARVHLARNLWFSIQDADRALVDDFASRRSRMHVLDPSHYEEKLAVLSNWLNNPGERAAQTALYRWTPEHARKVDDAIKRAYRGLRTTAASADQSWLTQRAPLTVEETAALKARAAMGKTEGLEKAEGGDSYATYRFPSEDEAETFALHYRDRYEDDWKGQGVSTKCWPFDGKEGERVYVAVRAWDEANQERAAALAREDGGEAVQAPDESIYDTLQPEARRMEKAAAEHCAICGARATARVRGASGRARAACAAHVGKVLSQHGEGVRAVEHLGKAEVAPAPLTEVQTLLKHPDPRERALALKLGSATARDAAQAALDPDPWVWRAALNHPVHGAHAKAALAASNRDSSGALMHVQHAELRADPSLAPEHLQAMHRAWRDDQGSDLNLQVRVHEMGMTAAHPRFPREGLGKSEAARGRIKSNSRDSVADASREAAMPHVGHLTEAWHRAGSQKEDDPAFRNMATNENDFISPKAIYSLPVAGHDKSQRFMAKPYGEKDDQLSGWAEGTSQALFHAAGIGHLHQDSFVAPHGHGDTAVPATVIHMVPGKTYDQASAAETGDPGFRSGLAKIALMDHAMSQYDRHTGNILVRPDGSPLAIDNAQAFSPIQPPFERALRGRISEGEVAKELPWWRKASPDVRRALESRLSLIRDPHVRDSIARSFRSRADWLDQRAAEPVPNWKADVPLAKSLSALPDEVGELNFHQNVPFSPEKMEGLHRQLAAAPMPHVQERREHFEEHLNQSGKVAKPLLVTDIPAHAVNRKGKIAGVARKAFYDSPAGHSFMVKGTHDAHHFGLGAWGEATSQALYHAAGIGHLHQHSHVSQIRDPAGNTAHGTVVHVEHDSPTLDFARENDLPRGEQLYLHPQNDQKLRQIALMDAVTDNYDRHGQNLLIRRDGSPLAIDNAKTFEQDMDHGNPVKEGETPLGIEGSDAWRTTDGPNSETWRWYRRVKPAILSAMEKQFDLLPDREFRDKTRQRFLDRLKRVEEYER
jgi:8-oxo-dGTP pyrophosphatase MutT (NUDIX family)